MLSVVRQLETTLSCLLKPQLSLIFYFSSSDSVLSFSLSCVCLGLNTSECLSSSSAVVLVLFLQTSVSHSGAGRCLVWTQKKIEYFQNLDDQWKMRMKTASQRRRTMESTTRKRETREKAKTIGEDGREGKEGGRERPGDLTWHVTWAPPLTEGSVCLCGGWRGGCR